MTPIALLVIQFGLIAAGVVVAWVVSHRRLPAPWSAIGWGVLAFPLSQVARMALMIPAGMGLTAWLGAGSAALTTASLVLAVLTSGLFEEGTRWIVIRYWAKGVRAWREGVAFGLGHGGIEAILVFGIATVTGAVLLTVPDLITSTVGAWAPEQSAALAAQIQALQHLTPADLVPGIWERALAVTFHVVCSLVVLQSVRTRRPVLLLLALALHCGFNAIAVTAAAQLGSPVVVELVLTACVAPLVWVVLRGPLSRRRVDGDAVPA